jgi:hypothetical protein
VEALNAVLILEAADLTVPEAKGRADSLMVKAEQALKRGAGFEGGVRERPFLVQYNPTSLKFSGSTGNREIERENKEMQIPGKSSLSMSVDLVFYGENDQDASVFYTMETLMYTIKTSATKGVKFVWGNMLVEGEITGFNVSYKMFNLLGMPLSATVSLNIRIRTKASTVEKRIENMTKGQPYD